MRAEGSGAWDFVGVGVGGCYLCRAIRYSFAQ